MLHVQAVGTAYICHGKVRQDVVRLTSPHHAHFVILLS